MYNSTNGDAFCEVLVKRRRGTPETVKMVLSILAGMVVSILIFMFIPMFFILIVPVWALIVFVIKMQKREYEYIFTSGDLDNEAFIGYYNIKNILSLYIEHIKLIAPENSHDLDGYKGNPNYRHYDFSANDAMLTNYIIIGNWNNQHVFVKFTPNERLLDDMFRISPGKVRRR